MSFDRYEESRRNGSPIQLFRFQIGPRETDFFYYTNAEQDITVPGPFGTNVTYKSVPIKSDKIIISGTMDKSSLKIYMGQDLEIPALYRAFPPSYVINLVIFQGHSEDKDKQFLASWTGRVLNCAEDENDILATLSCDPISLSMQRPGLQGNYQYGCRVHLYGSTCKAAKIARPATVTAVPGGVLMTVTPSPAFDLPDDAFQKGMVEWTDTKGRFQTRSIYGITRSGGAVTLKLSGLIDADTVGLNVSIFPGCKHDVSDCKNIHNNINNYRGCLWIPKTNPINNVTIFT